MGAVYKARQKSLERIVALKVLPAEVGRDPTFAERFTREARSLARLTHPNLLTVFEFGETGNLYFLIMEYVDGVNLRQAIQAKSLSPAETLGVVQQICDALQYAHDEGIVHRDIKPENVLLDRKGRVKIADFGLAKLLGRSPVDITLTAAHQVMGTLHYMAPEQIERPLDVDHRADIYSLGVVFYELLTGHLPLGRFPLPSEKAAIGARLDEVVLRTLERDPDRRYQQASAVKTDVEACRNAAPSEQRDSGSPEAVGYAAPLAMVAGGSPQYSGSSPAPLGAKATGSNPGPTVDRYVFNPGVILMAAGMGLAGGLILCVGLSMSQVREFFWAGMGTMVGAGAVAAGAWKADAPIRRSAPLLDHGKLVFGAVMAVVGIIVLSVGWNRGKSEFIWVGFGLICGSGAIARGGWPAAEDDETSTVASGASSTSLRKPLGPDESDPQAVAGIRRPAIGLILSGALGSILLPLLAMLPTTLITNRLQSGDTQTVTFSSLAILLLALCVLSLAIGCLQILSGILMLRCRWRGLATLGAISAMLPINAGLPLSLPMGIWALVVLTRPESKREFEIAHRFG